MENKYDNTDTNDKTFLDKYILLRDSFVKSNFILAS